MDGEVWHQVVSIRQRSVRSSPPRRRKACNLLIFLHKSSSCQTFLCMFFLLSSFFFRFFHVIILQLLFISGSQPCSHNCISALKYALAGAPVDVPESSAVCESVERGGDGEQEEQRQTVDERTDLLYCTGGH